MNSNKTSKQGSEVIIFPIDTPIVRFNQKLVLIWIIILVCFNLISVITEFSYYSKSLCFVKQPTKLMSKALYESDASYRDY